MKKFKFLSLFLISILLSGCNSWKYVPIEPELEIIEVARITTDSPVVEVELNDYSLLNYTIWPLNATDKGITIDKTYLSGVADITVDEYNNVYAWGIAEGTGVLSIRTSNDKYVSYSINVVNTSPAPEPEPDLPTIDKIANYFNEAAEDIDISYIPEEECWFGVKSFGYSTDPSEANLRTAAYFVKTFLPKYMYRYEEKYGTETGKIAFSLVMVNTNISAIAHIISYIEADTLKAEITIYSNR